MAPQSPLRNRSNNNSATTTTAALDSLIPDMMIAADHFLDQQENSIERPSYYSPSKQQYLHLQHTNYHTPVRGSAQKLLGAQLHQNQLVNSPSSPDAADAARWVPPSPSVDRLALKRLQVSMLSEPDAATTDLFAEATAAMNAVDESFEAEMMNELKELRDVADSRQQQIFNLEAELDSVKAQRDELIGDVEAARAELQSVRDHVSESFRSPGTQSVVSGHSAYNNTHSSRHQRLNNTTMSSSGAAFYVTSPSGQLLPPGSLGGSCNNATLVQQFVDEAAAAARRRLEFGERESSACPAPLSPAAVATCEMGTNTCDEDFTGGKCNDTEMLLLLNSQLALPAAAAAAAEEPRRRGRFVHAGVGVLNVRKFAKLQNDRNRRLWFKSMRLFVFDTICL